MKMNITQGGATLIPKMEKRRRKWGETKGDNGFRGRPSHHWMMVSIQASVIGFQLFSIGINLSIFVNFMLALIVLSSITKKEKIVTNMAPFMPFRVILVIV